MVPPTHSEQRERCDQRTETHQDRDCLKAMTGREQKAGHGRCESRSAATHMARLGIPQEHIERVLGHAIEGVAGTYNRYSYLSEKRAALDLWGAQWS